MDFIEGALFILFVLVIIAPLTFFAAQKIKKGMTQNSETDTRLHSDAANMQIIRGGLDGGMIRGDADGGINLGDADGGLNLNNSATGNGTDENSLLMFESMPMACNLWDKNFRIFDCNEENIKLLKAESKQDLIERFFDYSPPRQHDDIKSPEKAEKMLRSAFEDGRCVFEWMHKMADGELLPTEITLIRVPYKGGHAVAGYTRDLREQKKMIEEIERHELLDAVNKSAALLLKSDTDEFEKDLHSCMGIIAEAVEADCVYICKNYFSGEKLHCTELYEWSNGLKLWHRDENVTSMPYSAVFQGWEEVLAAGKCINSYVRDMLPEPGSRLAAKGVISVFAAPVFIKNSFWGFIGFDFHQSKRLLSHNEEAILGSCSFLFANALLRNEITLDSRAAAIKLENALIKAENTNFTKNNFLISLSHEMRTPMNAIIGLLELMLGEGSLEREIVENLDRIYVAGVTLLNIINDILDISSIETGVFEIIPADYGVASLINDTISLNILLIADKPIDFRLIVDEALPSRLIGDNLRIKQVCNNLLSNAFKYTEEGVIEFHISHEQDADSGDIYLICRVRDTGAGIASVDLEHIMAGFGKKGGKPGRLVAGMGLGIPLSMLMAELMGGGVTVESEYGKGSEFTARFRQKIADSEPIGADVARSLQMFCYEEEKSDPEKDIVYIQMPYAKVLLVDDVATNLDVARGMMKPYGMWIDCASNGRQAIEMIREGMVKYNAIFLDHLMPELDGVETARIIREEVGTEYAKNIPIIAMTVNAVAGSEEMFLQNGFQAFLAKPIDVELLDMIIRKWVRDKDLENMLVNKMPDEADARENAASMEIDDGYEHLVSSRKRRYERRVGSFGTDISDGIVSKKPSVTATNETEKGVKSVKTSNVGADKVVKANDVKIPGLRIYKGIERFGNEEAYFKILGAYISNTPRLLSQMIDVNERSLMDYAMVVHGIKGNSLNICADSLGARAEQLEQAAKNGNYTYVKRHNEEFVNAAYELIDKVAELLHDISGHKNKPMAAEPDRHVLAALKAACEIFDIDGVDWAMEELDKYEYENPDLYDWLKEKAAVLGFRHIVKRLENIADDSYEAM